MAGATEQLKKADVPIIDLTASNPIRCGFVYSAVVIFAHNHPSGELQPSEADLRVHGQWTEAGKIPGLRVLDHVIVTRKGRYSFQEAGLIR